MAVNLSKGQKISLDKGMTLALVGLGWDTNRYSGGAEFDLDASAFLLGGEPAHERGCVHGRVSVRAHYISLQRRIDSYHRRHGTFHEQPPELLRADIPERF